MEGGLQIWDACISGPPPPLLFHFLFYYYFPSVLLIYHFAVFARGKAQGEHVMEIWEIWHYKLLPAGVEERWCLKSWSTSHIFLKFHLLPFYHHSCLCHRRKCTDSNTSKTVCVHSTDRKYMLRHSKRVMSYQPKYLHLPAFRILMSVTLTSSFSKGGGESNRCYVDKIGRASDRPLIIHLPFPTRGTSS